MTMQFHSFTADMQPDLQVIKLNADNETLTGVGVDTLGYQGVVFIVSVDGLEVANFSIKAQQDSDVAWGTVQDLLGSSVAFTTGIGTDGFAFVEIKNPLERYVRPQVVVPNVTTPTAVSVVSIRYGKDWLPETNADGEFHDHPIEGTA
jgi:hypothetical protein